MGFSPINLAGHRAAEWEIPYEVIGAGEEPRAIVIEYEVSGRAKEKVQDPDFILWAIKQTVVPDSARKRIPPDFEGIVMFGDDKKSFPAAMGLARKSLLEKTNFCYTLNGTGVSIENGTNRTIEVESVCFVRENQPVKAYLNEADAQQRFVPTKTLRGQERDVWIMPKYLYPEWQETREVEIAFRITVGEESFVDTITKKL